MFKENGLFLIKIFSSTCDWVVDNELPIHLVENILDANLTVINIIKAT